MVTWDGYFGFKAQIYITHTCQHKLLKKNNVFKNIFKKKTQSVRIEWRKLPTMFIHKTKRHPIILSDFDASLSLDDDIRYAYLPTFVSFSRFSYLCMVIEKNTYNTYTKYPSKNICKHIAKILCRNFRSYFLVIFRIIKFCHFD